MARAAKKKESQATLREFQTSQAGLTPQGEQINVADLQKLLGGTIAEAKKLEVPLFYAAGVQMIATGNDFTLIFNRPRPVLNPDGSVNANAAVAEPVLSLSITPQTAKDLLVILQTNLPEWEKLFGTIQTPFTRSMEHRAADEAKKN